MSTLMSESPYNPTGYKAAFRDLLHRFDACLFHCSGFTKLGGNAQTNALGPLERIHEAITKSGFAEISCSTARPRYNFRYDAYNGSFLIGPLGLIVEPEDDHSITGAYFKDFGSYINDVPTPGRRYIAPDALPMTFQHIKDAVVGHHRSAHNEITVHRYRVRGLFYQPLDDGDYVQMNEGQPPSIRDITPADLHAAFGGFNHPMYCRDQQGMHLCHWNGQQYQRQKLVTARDIYP